MSIGLSGLSVRLDSSAVFVRSMQMRNHIRINKMPSFFISCSLCVQRCAHSTMMSDRHSEYPEDFHRSIDHGSLVLQASPVANVRQWDPYEQPVYVSSDYSRRHIRLTVGALVGSAVHTPARTTAPLIQTGRAVEAVIRSP